MLFMAISGVVLWWPRTIHRLKASFTIKLKGNKFRINRDTHGAIGIWGLLVFVIVSFSGVYLAFPKAMSSGITAVFPGRDIKDNSIKVAEIKSAKPINIDKAISIALSAHPDLKVISANLSTKPDQPYRINLAQHDYEDRQPLTTLFINPWNSEIIETRNPELYTTGETIIAWQLSLHSGDGIGAPWKVLIFLNGFLPLMFTITGITMWLIKRKARKAD
jgi:uncharacterized iron-regulated membrane protein